MSVNLSELFPPSGGSSGGGGGDCNIDVSENPPAPPYEVGQQFFSTSTGREYVWIGSEWVATSVAGGATGDGGGSGGLGGDPNWSDVTLLINTDGQIHGSQNIYDETSINNITVVNEARVNGNTYKYGTGSVYFRRASESKLEISGNKFAVPSGPFTIECWFYQDTQGGTGGIFGIWGADASKRAVEADVSSTGSLRVQIVINGTQTKLDNGSTAAPMQEWNHLAISWDGTTYYTHLNGEMCGSLSSNSPLNSSFDVFSLGHLWTATQYLEGYIDDFRVTDGIVRYTIDDFTPPGKHPLGQARKEPTIVSVDPVTTQEDSNDVELP